MRLCWVVWGTIIQGGSWTSFWGTSGEKHPLLSSISSGWANMRKRVSRVCVWWSRRGEKQMFSIADCPVRLVCCDIGQTEEGMLSNTPQAQMYIYSEHIINIFFFLQRNLLCYVSLYYHCLYVCIEVGNTHSLFSQVQHVLGASTSSKLEKSSKVSRKTSSKSLKISGQRTMFSKSIILIKKTKKNRIVLVNLLQEVRSCHLTKF